MALPPEPVTFPIWRGRQGVINTAICGVLGLLCAAGLFFLAHRTVVTGCTAYGQSHGLTYVDYTVYSSSRRNAGACQFRANGTRTNDVTFSEAMSWFTDLWLGIAFALEFTIPTFIVLIAVGRSLPYYRAARAGQH